MGNIETVGPNEALVVSGGWCGSTSKKMVIGGWAWAWWMVTDVQRLSLEIMTLKPKCESVETAQGVPLCVTGIAQCKVMTEKDFLPIAAEQFLGMSIQQIKAVLLETLEGHLRAILGMTLTLGLKFFSFGKFFSQLFDIHLMSK
jgi:flotillin